MAIVFHRELAIPLWMVAVCAVALTAPPRVMPSVVALLTLAVIASMMTSMVQWRSTCRPLAHGLPATGPDSRTQEAADAIDLVRMDDDGWQRGRSR